MLMTFKHINMQRRFHSISTESGWKTPRKKKIYKKKWRRWWRKMALMEAAQPPRCLRRWWRRRTRSVPTPMGKNGGGGRGGRGGEGEGGGGGEEEKETENEYKNGIKKTINKSVESNIPIWMVIFFHGRVQPHSNHLRLVPTTLPTPPHPLPRRQSQKSQLASRINELNDFMTVKRAIQWMSVAAATTLYRRVNEQYGYL